MKPGFQGMQLVETTETPDAALDLLQEVATFRVEEAGIADVNKSADPVVTGACDNRRMRTLLAVVALALSIAATAHAEEVQHLDVAQAFRNCSLV